MAFLTLDMKGVAAALVLGLALLLLGNLNLVFVAFMLYFLLLSSIVTSAGRRRKKAMGVYQKSRSVENVISNGCGPLIFAFLFFIAMYGNMPAFAVVSLAGFGASVAAVTSDKFSSELGVLDGEPKDIITLKNVKRGASGGVTPFGLTSGLFAAILVALPFSLAVFKLGTLLPQYSALAVPALVAVVIGGFAGTIVDSLLGHYEEKGIGNKFTSNFVCSVCGGVIGLLLLALVV